jgi:hypothetical protein
MSHKSLRLVRRFEKLALPYIRASETTSHEMFDLVRRDAFDLVANICLLVLYGKPRNEESLLCSWDRVRNSAEWQERRQAHPDFAEYGREDRGEVDEYEPGPGGNRYFQENGLYVATPFDRLGAKYIADYFRRYFLPDLAGADEAARLNVIFKRTPPWLLWFTNADVAGLICGLSVPDLSSVNKFARRESSVRWPLPEGPFERTLRPEGVADWFQAMIKKTAEKRNILPDDLTPRERKRALRLSSEAKKL